MDLDGVPLWRGENVPLKQLAEDFARYLYLPRLTRPSVLIGAIRDGLSLLTWEQDSFAYADSLDEATGRYRGLRGGQQVELSEFNISGLLVKSDVAIKQMEAERQSVVVVSPSDEPTSGPSGPQPGSYSSTTSSGSASPSQTSAKPPAPKIKRFHGAVTLDDTRVGRDASKIAEEVIAHLVGLPGTKVKVTLEIEADISSGAPDNVVRTVTENCRTLKFSSQGFEEE